MTCILCLRRKAFLLMVSKLQGNLEEKEVN